MKNLVLIALFLALSSVFVYNSGSFQAGRSPAQEKKLTEKQKEIQKYNMIFPYYAQVCSNTQYVRRTGEFDANGSEILDRGGNGGHATIFLKGACLDNTKGIPQIKMCDSNVDLTSHDAGVGISVNKIFDNVNWMATPGRSMFFNGGLGEEEVLTSQAFDEVISKVVKSGWLNGIKIKEEILKKEADAREMSLEEIKDPKNQEIYQEVIARSAIGTDFALSFARSSFCSRIPLPKDRLEKMVEFINKQNLDSFQSGYAWDGVYDNCSHLTSNAFAATGIFDYKKTYFKTSSDVLNAIKTFGVILKSAIQALFNQMPDMSTPANNVVRLAEASFERNIENAAKAYGNKDNRRTLMSENPWLPTSHGALLELVPVKPADKNEMFVQGGDPIIFTTLFIKPLKAKYDKYIDPNDPENKRYYDLEANLEYHARKYEHIWNERKSLNQMYHEDFKMSLPVNGNQQVYDRKHAPIFTKFYKQFYTHIIHLNQDVQGKLQRLKDLKKDI